MNNKELKPNQSDTVNETVVEVLTTVDKKKKLYNLPKAITHKEPTPEQIQAFSNVCNVIAKGYSVHEATKEVMQLCYSSFNALVSTKHPQILEIYARATEEREVRMFESILNVAENRAEDLYMTDKGVLAPNPVAVQRDRLIIDTKLKVLARMNNKKYGTIAQEKNDVTVNVQQITGMVVK
jgi:hypothetical protein